jgi:hypothetical protein
LFQQACFSFAVGAFAVLLAGCTPRSEPKNDEPPAKGVEAPAADKFKAPALAGAQQVTLHVPEMTEKLRLT